MKRRDKMDSSRLIAPLRPAPDAVIVNTDGLNICQVLKKLREMM
jgi:cytidylate kinase